MVNKLEAARIVIGIATGVFMTVESLNALIPAGMWLYLGGLIIGPALLYVSVGMLLDLNVDIEGDGDGA